MSSSSFWDVLGNLASLVQLTGVDAFLVVSMIAQAARTAQHNRDLCQQLSREVVIVGGLLEKLQIPELRRYRETRQALDELGKALFRGYVLVWCCSQQQSTLLQIFKANDMASMLGRAKEDIHFYISLIPTIKFVAYVRRIQDDETNDLGPAQRPRLSIQEVTDWPPTSIQAVTNSLALEEQRPQPYPNFTQNLELTQSQFSRASASNWAQGLTNVERLLELVVMIGHSADTASYNSVQCQQLAYRALIIGSMVETRWRLRRPLEQLEDVLRRGYILVSLCSHYSRSQLRLIFTRADVASVFRLAQEEMIRQIYFLTDPSPVEEARDVTNNHARIPSDVLSPPGTTFDSRWEHDDCEVCLEELDIRDHELVMLPCHHAFHGRCISDWLRFFEFNPSCPICKFVVPSDFVRFGSRDAAENAIGFRKLWHLPWLIVKLWHLVRICISYLIRLIISIM